jgi:hypothetical protein
MTPLSLVPEQALAAGIVYTDLVDMLVKDALRRSSARPAGGGADG